MASIRGEERTVSRFITVDRGMHHNKLLVRERLVIYACVLQAHLHFHRH